MEPSNFTKERISVTSIILRALLIVLVAFVIFVALYFSIGDKFKEMIDFKKSNTTQENSIGLIGNNKEEQREQKEKVKKYLSKSVVASAEYRRILNRVRDNIEENREYSNEERLEDIDKLSILKNDFKLHEFADYSLNKLHLRRIDIVERAIAEAEISYEEINSLFDEYNKAIAGEQEAIIEFLKGHGIKHSIKSDGTVEYFLD